MPTSGDSQSRRPATLTWQLPSISKPAGVAAAVWGVVGHGRSGFTPTAAAGVVGPGAGCPPATSAPATTSRVTRPSDVESLRLRFIPTLLITRSSDGVLVQPADLRPPEE